MTTALNLAIETSALAPVHATLRAMPAEQTAGLAPHLLVRDATGWLPATSLIDGSHVPALLDAAAHRWGASPHAAAALAWKAYTYWLSLPTVLGWASARRVPLVEPADVLVSPHPHRPVITLGLRPGIRTAVLPTDPLAISGRRRPGIVVVPDEAALLAALRASLLDSHLMPLLKQVQRHVRLGTRTMLGSLASSVSHGVLRAADTLPGSTMVNIETLLAALDVADLVALEPGPAGLGVTVRRRTCCLAFTLPEPKVCAGCCIESP